MENNKVTSLIIISLNSDINFSPEKIVSILFFFNHDHVGLSKLQYMHQY